MSDQLDIQRGSWIENQNFWHTLAQTLGTTHPRVIRQGKEVEKIKEVMQKLENEINRNDRNDKSTVH